MSELSTEGFVLKAEIVILVDNRIWGSGDAESKCVITNVFDDDGIFVLAAWKELDTARYRGNL